MSKEIVVIIIAIRCSELLKNLFIITFLFRLSVCFAIIIFITEARGKAKKKIGKLTSGNIIDFGISCG